MSSPTFEYRIIATTAKGDMTITFSPDLDPEGWERMAFALVGSTITHYGERVVVTAARVELRQVYIGEWHRPQRERNIYAFGILPDEM